VTDEKLVQTSQWRKQMHHQLAEEIAKADRTPEQHREADALLTALDKALNDAPLDEKEKLRALFTRLVEELAAVDSDRERKAYVERFCKLLRDDIVGAARRAFPQIR
jgi:ribosomal protein L17